MTLEKELLEKGFRAKGPFADFELGEAVEKLFTNETMPAPVYVHIIQAKIARDDMNSYSGLYMIYYSYETLSQ